MYTITTNSKKIFNIQIIGKPPNPTPSKFSGYCSDRDGNVTISWKQQNNAGQTISYYVVQYTDQNKDSRAWVSHVNATATQLTIPVTELPPSADLVFRVTAVTEFEGDVYKSDPVPLNSKSECVTPAGRKCCKYVWLVQ